MAGEWPTVRLVDHVESCLGKMLDKEKNRGKFFPYLGNKNVRWGSFDTENLAQMRFEEHEHERYGLKYGDLIVCEGGEPGRCAIWKDEIPGMKIQKALHRIRPREGLDNIYLHYWFLWSGRNGSLEPFFTGTTIKHLTGKAIAELDIPLPSLSEQKTIAHILGTLDDKIELNRQMNATLEAMAQALFKSWFVDFDPVIDNALAAGHPIPEPLHTRAEAHKALGDKRKPLPEAIQKQFPSRFVFNEEMGWVPEGWGVSQLGGAIDLATGPAFKSKEFTKQGIRLARGDNVKEGKFQWGDKTRYWPEITEGLERYKLIAGDVLIGMDGSKVGKNWVRVGASDLPCLLVQRVARLRPIGLVGSSFLEVLIGGAGFKRYVDNVKTGTSIPHISGGQIKSLSILNPNDGGEIFNEFERQLLASAQRKEANLGEINTLSKLRDTLLPKLLSGQLRIPDAEKLAEEALA
ncbi:restriction endonuclease subunit S [bacterium endosymbiont of Escarpia laminata]|nr:MAG: restriction endonuclease subunit S [bacterium endosymbiont of Escarpia laminata]